MGTGGSVEWANRCPSNSNEPRMSSRNVILSRCSRQRFVSPPAAIITSSERMRLTMKIVAARSVIFSPNGVPYIAHFTGTMCILARVGVRDEVLAAAILHDYLEDVPDPDGRESIRAALGEEVLSLVLEVTEHKRRGFNEVDTWDIRKQEQLDHIERMPREAVLIKAADVLHNLLSLLSDLEAAEDPDTVWKTVQRGPRAAALVLHRGHRCDQETPWRTPPGG